MGQTGSPKLLGLELDLSATTAQNTVIPRRDRILWVLVLERVVIGQFYGTKVFFLGSGSVWARFCSSFCSLFFFLLSLFLSFVLLSLSWLDLQDQAARFLTTT